METADSKEEDSPRAGCDRRETNVGTQERTASVVTGALVALFGMRRGGFSGALMTLAGGGLVLRGMTGRCPAYAALGMNTAEPYEYDANSYDYGSRQPARPEAAGGTGEEPGRGTKGTAETRPFDVRTEGEL